MAAPTKQMYDAWSPEKRSEWDRYGEMGDPRGLNSLFPPKRGEEGRGFIDYMPQLISDPNDPERLRIEEWKKKQQAQMKEINDLKRGYGKNLWNERKSLRGGPTYTPEFIQYAKDKGFKIDDRTAMDAGQHITKEGWHAPFSSPTGDGPIPWEASDIYMGDREPWVPPKPDYGVGPNPWKSIRDPNDPLPSPPTTMPVPQPPVMPTPSPPTTMPLPQPPKTGGPFGGEGGNFLNRLERLLDGLEGLVGKLGADGSTPESPFSSGGGGLSDAIETPFTPTQDY